MYAWFTLSPTRKALRGFLSRPSPDEFSRGTGPPLSDKFARNFYVVKIVLYKGQDCKDLW